MVRPCAGPARPSGRGSAATRAPGDLTARHEAEGGPVRPWSPLTVGMAVAVGAAVYALEWLLAVPTGDAFVDATLGAFVTLLILGWWRG